LSFARKWPTGKPRFVAANAPSDETIFDTDPSATAAVNAIGFGFAGEMFIVIGFGGEVVVTHTAPTDTTTRRHDDTAAVRATTRLGPPLTATPTE
jgi:hypothetical protein